MSHLLDSVDTWIDGSYWLISVINTSTRFGGFWCDEVGSIVVGKGPGPTEEVF